LPESKKEAIAPAFGGVISGLFLVISGQITRATVNNTDNTGEMLTIMKAIAAERERR